MTPSPPGEASFPAHADRIDAIVVGASAGGVEALAILLPALPARLHAAMLIVLHLPRERASLLAEIFAPKCARPLREAQDKEPVEPGTVYFAPPDYHLLVDKSATASGSVAKSGESARKGVQGAQLALSADEPVNYSRPSIDVLFESAADVYGQRLLGIVLTGANQDGAAGLAAVHQAGGLTVAQQPDTAHSSLMPMAAIKRTPVDYVLTLDQIADLLRALDGGAAAGPASINLGVTR